MLKRHIKLILWGLGSAWIFAVILACSSNKTTTTAIRHPMQAGQIDQNRVPISSTAIESRHGLQPTTLDHEASLLSMDPQGICFNVRVRTIDDGTGAAWTDLRNWEVTLNTQGDNNVSLVSPSVELVPATSEVYNGLVEQEIVVGEKDECTERDGSSCVRWEKRPIVETEMVPGQLNVVTGGGKVCFANQGNVTPQTPGIELRLHRLANTLNFQWEFQSIVQ